MAVTIALTKLDVNDTGVQSGGPDPKIELRCRIKNNTDHDVWVCSSLSEMRGNVFEYFMDKDAKTLVIRRRFDLPATELSIVETRTGLGSRYVRLRPGQEELEFFSLAMPVSPLRILGGESGNAKYAERLAVEIGFYDEDLPGLILQIVDLAKDLNCDLHVGLRERLELGQRFFGGRQIAQAFNSFSGWSASITSGDDDIWMPHMGQTRMGEKVLRIEVDGVSIPYKSDYPPMADRGRKGTKDPQSKKADIAKLAKADSKKPLEQQDAGTGK